MSQSSSTKNFEGYHHLASARIGVVTARFNANITDKLREGAIAELGKWGYTPEQILEIQVPGAYEIPLAAQWLLKNNCDGVIALGAVIRGETTHYDYVCSAVERGCSRLQLDFSKPVVFGVLTTENLDQAVNRIGGTHGHKGIEAAQVLIEMIHLKQIIDPTPKPKGDHPWPNPAI